MLLKGSRVYWRRVQQLPCFFISCSKLAQAALGQLQGSNLTCDWLSIIWTYSEQEVENGPRSASFVFSQSCTILICTCAWRVFHKCLHPLGLQLALTVFCKVAWTIHFSYISHPWAPLVNIFHIGVISEVATSFQRLIFIIMLTLFKQQYHFS